jgi:hypothetical protein
MVGIHIHIPSWNPGPNDPDNFYVSFLSEFLDEYTYSANEIFFPMLLYIIQCDNSYYSINLNIGQFWFWMWNKNTYRNWHFAFNMLISFP